MHNNNHHSHKSHHHHFDSDQGKKLMITFFINLIVSLMQIAGSIFAGSMALLSDALHNLSDSTTLMISWAAERLTKRRSTINETFGYKRAEIVAAFFNASLLLVVGVYLIYESVNRIITRQYIDVKPGIVIVLALVGIIANGFSALILKKDSESNMNIRSSYIHLFIDMLSSVAVLAGGILIYYLGLYLVDPLLSIAIAIYLILLSWNLVLQSLKVLMQFTPSGLDLEVIVKQLSDYPGIKGIHHIHAWQLNDHDIYFEAHVEFLSDLRISESCDLLRKMKEDLARDFNIMHSTFQSEYELQCDKSIINQGKPH
jgi:cobalt-zinc-cadmium efflux system protein